MGGNGGSKEHSGHGEGEVAYIDDKTIYVKRAEVRVWMARRKGKEEKLRTGRTGERKKNPGLWNLEYGRSE